MFQKGPPHNPLIHHSQGQHQAIIPNTKTSGIICINEENTNDQDMFGQLYVGERMLMM